MEYLQASEIFSIKNHADNNSDGPSYGCYDKWAMSRMGHVAMMWSVLPK